MKNKITSGNSPSEMASSWSKRPALFSEHNHGSKRQLAMTEAHLAFHSSSTHIGNWDVIQAAKKDSVMQWVPVPVRATGWSVANLKQPQS